MNVNIDSAQRYLQQAYRIHGRISTTVSYGFASAVAPQEPYDEDRVRQAMVQLGQDPSDLQCVYCGAPAATWDHLHGMVDGGEFSGYGQLLGNLVPACSRCNGAKGNRPWRDFVAERVVVERRARVTAALAAHEARYLGTPVDLDAIAPEEMARFRDLRMQVRALMREADQVAEEVRVKSRRALWPDAPAARPRRGTRRPVDALSDRGPLSSFYRQVFQLVERVDFRPPTVRERSWCVLQSQRWGGFWIWVTADELRVVAYLGTTLAGDKVAYNKARFDELRRDEAAIRRELGLLASDLRWDRLDHRQASWVGLVRSRPDLADPVAVEEAAAWAAAAVDGLLPVLEERLRDAPRLATLASEAMS